MRRNHRALAYVAVALVLVSLAVFSPHAWATAGQSALAQGGTVPTMTPTSRPSTGGGGSTPVPPPTSASGAPTATTAPVVAPAATPALTPPAWLPTAAAPSANSALELTITADRRSVWPGAPVQIVLTVANRGATALSDVRVTSTLPAGLDPAALPAGSPAAWSGRTLQAQIAGLNASASVAIPFGVTVSQSVSGSVIQDVAVATAAGGLQTVAWVNLVLPPAQLPATGARLALP